MSYDFLPSLIEKTFPIPGRFRSALPSHVAELSRLLTGARGDRSLSYLSRPNFLSAYLRYFLPWNILRLCRLLPSLDISLNAGDVIVDLGCGPLTFTSALWLSRPDLRSVPLEFYCVDNCAPVLAAGKKFFATVCKTELSETEDCAWKVNTVREKINFKAKTALARKKAALVCAVNLFNEIYEDLPHTNVEALKRSASAAARLMCNQAEPGGFLLTVEPGVPQSGYFISFLRSAFLEMNRPPLSPCTHQAECPMSGGGSAGGGGHKIVGGTGRKSADHKGKTRWCHFAFDTADAPKELCRLSSAAGIPKERLVLSYLLVGAEKTQAAHVAHAEHTANASQTAHVAQAAVRVISDAFSLPENKYGRYACGAEGLVLLTGDKTRIEKISSGELAPISVAVGVVKNAAKGAAVGARDQKSGALIMELK